MRKKLSNYFRLHPWDTCYVTIFVLICIAFVFLYYQTGGFTPPTEKDYKPLHEQEELIIKDFDIVYEFDNYKNYPSDDGKIIVELTSNENTNLSLNIVFTQNKQFISSKEISEQPGFETDYSLLRRILSFSGLIVGFAFLAMIFAVPVSGILYIICKISQSLKKRC